MTTDARVQLRGGCPACFATQALRDGRMVQHGYRRPQHWHQNVGTCTGTGEAHFGTEAGRDYTRGLADGLRLSAANERLNADRVRAGEAAVYVRRRAYGVWSVAAVESPSAAQRAEYATALAWRADQMLAQAKELDALVAAWTPAEPTKVAVETTAPTMHFRVAFYNRSGHHACAASAMGAQQYRPTTTNPAEVTCERCKTRKAFIQAAAAR